MVYNDTNTGYCKAQKEANQLILVVAGFLIVLAPSSYFPEALIYSARLDTDIF